MTTITLEIDSQEIIDNLNTTEILEELCDDITESNPDWWAERICQPLLPAIEKKLQEEDNELLREVVYNILEEYYDKYDVIAIANRIIKEYIESKLQEPINNLLTTVMQKIDNNC